MDWNKVLLSQTMKIIKIVVKDLQQDTDHIVDYQSMFHQDWLKLQHPTRATCCRVVMSDPMSWWIWIESSVGVSYPQIDTLTLLMHVLEGLQTDKGLQQRFKTIVYADDVNKDLDGIYTCWKLVKILLNSYMIAYSLHNMVGKLIM